MRDDVSSLDSKLGMPDVATLALPMAIYVYYRLLASFLKNFVFLHVLSMNNDFGAEIYKF